jgi:signal transduction histidine kinase
MITTLTIFGIPLSCIRADQQPRSERALLTISIISTDPELQALCRQMLADGAGSEWELHPVQPGGVLPESDLTVWDFNSGLTIPERIRSEAYKHLFLVERNDLEPFRARFAHLSAGILLKPVTKPALLAFVEQRGRKVDVSRENARIGELRAERDEMLQSLIMTCLKLQEYDQDRTRFLTRAVHDFRAPLTAVSGYCGMLLREQLGPLTGSQRDVVQRMQQSAKRLSRISTAMFQLGLARHFEPNAVLRAGNLNDCIDQALHELTHALDEKDLAVSVELLPAPGILLFDDSQLEQLFVNLLDNAFRFTPQRGTVEIKGYPFFWERRFTPAGDVGRNGDRRSIESFAANSYRVDIRDSGPGIPPENLDRIFEEYTSYSGGNDRSGGGLGLAICRMIATRHRGRIWAENGAGGAIFSLALPLGGAGAVQYGPNGDIAGQRISRGTCA